MQLSIITSSNQRTMQVEWVELNTVVGNVVIQQGHVPSVLILAPNSTVSYFILKNGQPESVTVKQAMAHVTRTDVTIIVTEQ